MMFSTAQGNTNEYRLLLCKTSGGRLSLLPSTIMNSGQ